MDSRFLKSLISVIECGSIAEASRREHLTAAAISQRIKSLEADFGFELLHRVGPSITPTDACKNILVHAKQIVEDVEQLSYRVHRSNSANCLRLGVVPSQITPRFIKKLSGLIPENHVSLFHDISRNLYSKLIAGEIDAAILEQPAFELPKTIQAYVLRTESLALITSENTKNLSVKEILASRPYIEYSPDPFITSRPRQFLSDHGLFLQSICESSSLHAIEIMVRDGLGVSLVPHWRHFCDEANDLHLIPIVESQYSRNLVMLNSKFSIAPQSLQALISILSEH